VEWGDCDPARIVFYPNYFRWFDAATHNLLSSVLGGWDELLTRFGVIGLPLVDARAEFVRPTRFGETIDIESRISRWERKVLTVEHKVSRGGAIRVTGREIRAWCVRDKDDEARLRAANIPPEFISLFGD
jgi:4-hydroxybenzoyl-CoA thioesterase